MLTRSEIRTFSKRSPDFDDMSSSLRAICRQPKAISRETRKVVALARKFNEQVVRPRAAEMDRRVQEDPNYLPWDFVETANRWGLYTLWIPRIFGGKGYALPSLSWFIEELASACTAMANLVGVHYLGVGTLISSWNTRMIQRVFTDVVSGEQKDKPCLISLALTEPDAGTDAEETDLMDRGVMTCHARKVPEGYRVNGRKVFISNGHLSSWHILISYADLQRPSSSLVMLAVKTGAKGFSFGRIEKKMGQKSCPASELVFDDCLVPCDQVCIDPTQADRLRRSRTATTMQIIDYVFGASRAAVGAFGAGVARGAYEAAVHYAATTEVQGQLLINHGWAQTLLARMYANVLSARQAYVEGNYANGIEGMFKLLQVKPVYYLIKTMPAVVLNNLVPPFMDSALGTWFMRKAHCDGQTEREIQRTSGLGSHAKVVGTDAGVENGQLAMDLMGQDGLRQENLAEKHLRDARLMQIYEGTNQLNRLNLFKCFIARDFPQAVAFSEKQAEAVSAEGD
jgi:acyl-CoA dehydrogenase